MSSRHCQHPAELSAAQDADCGSGCDGGLREPEIAQGSLDEHGLVHRVAHGVGDARRYDPTLLLGVCVPERDVVPQRVAQAQVAPDLLGVRGHVDVDLEDNSLVLDATEEQRAGGRKCTGAGLPLEAEREEVVGDAGDILGLSRDRQVDHVLACEARHGRASNVVDRKGGTSLPDERDQALGGAQRPRIMFLHLQLPVRIGQDRHRRRRRQGRSSNRGHREECRFP